jgi:hypothetical protein
LDLYDDPMNPIVRYPDEDDVMRVASPVERPIVAWWWVVVALLMAATAVFAS